ncbi:alpha amylase catalytic region [Catenulispora acidiphila DSM 44928]|uniref:Alpha amylase catalytic region n=1 Tax=Catenulispora acidiphila (strain DSM 44928 / JCM 14897 / NBRC 102108 / NRRL B-24433 / ID139908) TaxID=479433 RepID=C7QBZ1_CATAD|nr:glycoside hydrolase family 13 protein [Catenulispora acidiphila]ACU72610.1 alpha amylase catalytic region [Catenulispora acidiphila DSM 44928]
MQETTTGPTTTAWWRTASIYQIYVRSFADADGDGIGDLAGIRSRLPYLRDLGVDALWLTPWYVSPMADAGYDVADYCDIDPVFGDLAQARKLIDAVHGFGMRIIIDIVPNHCSDQHPWFQAALAAGPGAAERERFWFRPGRGADGSLPPNDWQSYFGGPAWTRITEPDGTPGPWFLHMFTPEQPDLNWEDPGTLAAFEQILRFWLDRGVDGFRIDVAHGLMKKQGLPDVGPTPIPHDLPYQDRPEVHDVYRAWRRVTDSYPGERVMVGEVWLPTPEQYTRYLRSDELHSAFNFEFLCSAWDSEAIRRVIDDTLASHAAVGAPPTWVLSNHDTIRHVTRYGRENTAFDMGDKRHDDPSDPVLGTRRARAAALLTLALPGGVYIYQGDELALPEVRDVPPDRIQDPTWERSGHTDRGRDGCRVPLPWSGEAPPFGFSDPEAHADPWLPQPASWKETTAAVQNQDPDSTLNLYREALTLRRETISNLPTDVTWIDAGADVVAFTRSQDFTCIVNFSATPLDLPPAHRVLLSSDVVSGGKLAPNAAVWLGARA